MKTAPLLLLALLWSLVEVHSQTAPYVSFMGENVPNHGYVDLNEVGDPALNDDDHTVPCHTDLESCCSGAQGDHRGDWYFPDGDRLPFPTPMVGIHQARLAQRVELRRNNNADSPSGIYRCDITTDAVQDNSVRETVHVGLYATGGDITVSDTITRANTGSDNEFTLTCISTGGPATTVTWTRDSVTVTEGTETVLDDPVTAQYTHTLTESTAGVYTCTVANDKPSSDAATITVEGPSAPTNVMAVPAGLTSIRVSWTPSSDATGYTISYTGGSSGSSGNVNVPDGSTEERLLTGLVNGVIYTISIMATSTGLSSGSVVVMDVRLLPGQPNITMTPTVTSTSISISWSVQSDSVVTSYEVVWQRDTSGECSDEDEGSHTTADDSTTYVIRGLWGNSRYSITVRAINGAGSSEVSSMVTAMTLEGAPSAPPTSISTSSTPTTITVQWGEVECSDHNGEITGYSVRYSGRGSIDTIPVSGGDTRQTTISGLTPSTDYTIEVAAVNNAGTGPYSSGMVERTPDAFSVMLDSKSTTSLTISWTLADGLTATLYTISYSNTNNTDCITAGYPDIPISAGVSSRILTGLEEATEYSITVTATLSDGGTREDSLTATTIASAPSAAPSNVRATSTSSSITVQWEMVSCIDRNGEITGYLVRYGVLGQSTQTMPVSGGDTTMTTISSVMSPITYSIEVAAVNSVDTGPYSDPITVETPRSVYLSLNSDIIPNHGYVMISDIGSTDNTALLCITNRPVLSGGSDSGGNWFAPDGDAVGTLGSSTVPGFDRNRDPMIVRLRRNDGTPEQGIYNCVVEDADFIPQTVYVGLYNSGGGMITIGGDVTLTVDSDLNGPSPQFTLTCISTGGPATTVTWTRDSETAVGTQISLVVDGVAAQYNHTLTVTGRLPGVYTCTVDNEVSPQDSESFTVEVASAPTNVMAVQEGPAGIRVSWISSSDATGYTISYTRRGSSDSVTVSGGSTDNYLLEGFMNGGTYNISIVATSQHFSSHAVELQVTLVSAPSQPSVSVTAITFTSISLSWSVPSGSVVTSSEVMWKEASSGTSEGTSGTLTDTSYTIDQLESTTIYNITVTVSNTAGSTDSQPVIISTNSDSCEAATDSCQIKSSDCLVIPAIIGGVVAIVIILTTALTVIVIVLVLRSKRRDYSTRSKSEVVVTPGATNKALELSKFSEEATADPDAVIHTSSNEAYGVRKTAQAQGGDAEYETVTAVAASTSHSTQPPTEDYEPV